MPESRHITIEHNREEKREDQNLQNKAKEDFRKNEETAHQIPGPESLGSSVIPAPEEESA